MPLSSHPAYPQGYDPASNWNSLTPQDETGARWFRGTAGMANLIHARQQIGFEEGPVYKIPLGRCVACLLRYSIECLEVAHLIHYQSLAGKSTSMQDLVNMHNDTSNLTFLCRGCNHTRQHQAFYDWLLQTVELEENGSRLARQKVLQQAWKDLNLAALQKHEAARQQSPHDVVGALQHTVESLRTQSPPNAKELAAAQMVLVNEAILMTMNERKYVTGFNLAQAVEAVAGYASRSALSGRGPGAWSRRWPSPPELTEAALALH